MTSNPPLRLEVEEHPLLRLAAFTTHFPAPLGDLPTPAEIQRLLDADAPAPLQREESGRTAVRDLLRWGGYKPTGRGKPASEYLVRAAGEGTLGSINLAVDACNVVSLHSALPISVVDLDLARPPWFGAHRGAPRFARWHRRARVTCYSAFLAMLVGGSDRATFLYVVHGTNTNISVRR
ncbi:hypothetical protein BH20GEM2_BH20GEM2_01480 [soil metagenome]